MVLLERKIDIPVVGQFNMKLDWLAVLVGVFSILFWWSDGFYLVLGLVLAVYGYATRSHAQAHSLPSATAEKPRQGDNTVVAPSTSARVITSSRTAEARASPAKGAPRKEAVHVAAEVVRPSQAAPSVAKVEVAPVAVSPVEPAKKVEPESFVPVESTPAQFAPVGAAPAPVEYAPAEAAPVPVKSAPVESAPVESAPVESAPVESAPVEVVPVEALVEAAPVESTVEAASEDVENDGADEHRLTLEESTAETDILYKKHRAEADEHARLRAQYFDEAAEAHKAGDGKRAKELSEQGKEHSKLMEEASLRAATAIFTAKNAIQPEGTIDLHGLQVKEAELIVTNELEKAKEKGSTELKIIIGAGHHSDAKGPKVGPAVKKLLKEKGNAWRDDETNASGGTIIATL